MHTPESLTELLLQSEGPTLEFKSNTPPPESLSRLISGFANSGGGTVIVGVQEPNHVLGTDVARFEKLVQHAKERLRGQLELVHYPVNIGGKSLGVIEVSAAKVPVATPEGYFQRVGERDEPLNAQQLVQRMSTIRDPTAAISALSETITEQSKELSKLRESFEKANSWQRKAIYALLGAIATAVVKLGLAAFGAGGG